MRVTVKVLVPPPLKVGVAPTTAPLVPCWIVMLCGSIEAFVKLTVTLPAFALSDDLVNLSAPLGSADWVRVLPPPPPAGAALLEAELAAEVAALAVVDVAGEEAGALLLLLLEPPHAARPSASDATLTARTGNLVKSALLSRFCAGAKIARRPHSVRS